MILVSACLVGRRCRYDGGTFDQYPELQAMVERGEAIAVCPEELGGLPTPRPPAEIVGGRAEAVLDGHATVQRADGTDVTAAFRQGADAVEAIARSHGATAAILKDRSPACGVHAVYDGTFRSVRVPGRGVAAERLASLGLALSTEADVERLTNP